MSNTSQQISPQELSLEQQLFQNITKKIQALKISSQIERQRILFDDLSLTLKIAVKEEEEIYTSYGHPDGENHIQLHEEIIRTLASFEHHYFTLKSSSYTFEEFVAFIEEWVNYHHNIEDHAMRPFIRLSDYAAT